MQAIYYTYWLQTRGHKYRQSILPLVTSFASVANPAIRSAFRTQDGDHLLLYRINRHVFLFVVTKDRRAIKAVSANTLTHTAIAARLRAGELIGFSSYVYIGDHVLAIASTNQGPRHGKWDQFVNDLLDHIGMGRVTFHSKPVPTSITTNAALDFAFKSKITMYLRRDNPFARQFLELVGDNGQANQLVVTIQPHKGRQVGNVWGNALAAPNMEGVRKLVVRGKQDLDDVLADFYVVGCGHAAEDLSNLSEDDVVRQLPRGANDMAAVREAINELAEDDTFADGIFQGADLFGHPDLWPDGVGGA